MWLDAGIVPFATLGWENEEWVTEGYATGAARGLTKADLPDHGLWERWFPADWVSEMREQIRLWFYSQFFMSVVLVGRSPYKRVLGYEKMLDEQGREMHALVGEHHPGRGRVRADGRRCDALAVLRPAARPEPSVRLRSCARDQAEAAHALALGQVPRRLREHRGLRALVGQARAGCRAASARPLARRADEAARRRGDRRLRGHAHGRRDARVRRVRRRRLQLVHPPFAAALLLLRRGGVPHALVRARAIAARRRAGDAVPRRPSLAQPRPGRSGVGAPRALARGRRARPVAARRDR